MWFLYGLIAVWLAQFAGALWFAFQYVGRVGNPAPADTEPPVTIIAPVKGAGRHLPAFIERLRSIDYPDYRILAVVESEDDPAVAVIRTAAAQPGVAVSVLIAGLAEREGQKVHNLRHALANLDERSRIVAFVDADTMPRPDWLQRLVRPLVRDPDIAAVTGHRWIVPDDDHLATKIVAAANLSLLALPRIWSVCWGGTLAMRRETVEGLNVRRRLEGGIVDDVHITRVLREEKLRILTPRGLVVMCLARHDWPSAIAFARRQYKFIRWYLPGSWAAAVALLTLPVVACLVAIVLAVQGDQLAAWALGVAIAFGIVRSVLRRRMGQIIWGDQSASIYGRQAMADRWLAAIWVPFHAFCAWSTMVSREMTWAGIRYKVSGRTATRVVGRRAVAPD